MATPENREVSKISRGGPGYFSVKAALEKGDTSSKGPKILYFRLFTLVLYLIK